MWVDAVLRSALLEVKERDALAAENVRLREALIYRVCRSCSLKPGSAECQAVECWPGVHAALSLQPPAPSPSAPEGVAGDSELERRIQKLEQMVDGIRCWTEQHDAALEEEGSHE